MTYLAFVLPFSPQTSSRRFFSSHVLTGRTSRRMCEPCTPDALLEAVRGLRVAEPDLGFKPLLAKLREQQPDLGAATKEVREALNALKAEGEAAKATAAAPPAAEAAAPPASHKGGAPSNVR